MSLTIVTCSGLQIEIWPTPGVDSGLTMQESDRYTSGQFLARYARMASRKCGPSVRVQPKTSLELSVQARDITYDHPRASGLNLDSRGYRNLPGVVWETIATTTGSVRDGWVEAKFDDPRSPRFFESELRGGHTLAPRPNRLMGASAYLFP
jgi:hypothetical protein